MFRFIYVLHLINSNYVYLSWTVIIYNKLYKRGKIFLHILFCIPIILYIFIISAILHYRTFRNNKKQNLKNQHAVCNGCIIILVLLAGFAAFVSHLYANPPVANLYTLHSWIGVVTILMFLSQVRLVFIVCIYYLHTITRGSKTVYTFFTPF